MKRIIFVITPAIILVGLLTCKRIVGVNPGVSNAAKADTSTNLISNTELVGNWNIVTDSVSCTTDTVYRGTAADHYIFTNYGNLYIKSGFENLTDTAVYTFPAANVVSWINSYVSELGSVSRSPSTVGPFTITSLTAHSLVLSQHANTAFCSRYEVITLKK